MRWPNWPGSARHRPPAGDGEGARSACTVAHRLAKVLADITPSCARAGTWCPAARVYKRLTGQPFAGAKRLEEEMGNGNVVLECEMMVVTQRPGVFPGRNAEEELSDLDLYVRLQAAQNSESEDETCLAGSFHVRKSLAFGLCI